jgi:hypothetical protein
MKSHIVKTTLLGLVAVALTITPTLSRAQDATNAPSATPKKHSGYIAFHGAVTAVDPGAETLTVSGKVITITSTTKIINFTNNAPATLSDVVVGETVSGSYVKDADGKLNAHSLHIGSKAKKKKPYTANTNTNSVSN